MSSTVSLIIAASVLLSIAALNVTAIAVLFRLHPDRKRTILLFALAGNLFWLCVPLLVVARASEASRVARSLLGPPWFMWLGFVLLYSAFALLLGIVRLIGGRFFDDFGRFAARASSTGLIVLLLLFLIGFYQALVPLDVREVPVAIQDLPQDLEGTRIALLSDLHVGTFTRPSRLDRIASAVMEARPDLVVVAGDLVDDDPYYVPKFIEGLRRIPARIPIIAVLGNHEMYVDPVETIKRLRPTRVRLLVNEGMQIARGGARLWLAGLSDFAGRGIEGHPELAPSLPPALGGRPADAVTIMLSHQPKAFPLARQARIPLTLCGHTHGGQLGIRSIRWTLAGVFLPYDIGLYREDGAQLYVTTGAGYWLVPFRLGLPPEIVMIELHRAPPSRSLP